MSALPLDHRCDCAGYRIDLPRAGRFDAEKAKNANIPVRFWNKLQKGETVTDGDNVYTPETVLGPPRRGLRVCYVTDTRPLRSIPGFIDGADLFICEGLYGDDEKLQTAREHMHMIFSEAAALARDGGAGELWLTHFSPAMPDPESYVNVAQNIFKNTKAGRDGMTATLRFED